MTPLLVADELVRRYAERAVVDAASLTLQRSETLALLGPSGCGKTTLLNLLGLLERPSAGRVLVDGVDAWTLSDRSRATLRLSSFGFVFQESHLIEHLSARDNVALPRWRLSGSRRQALAAADGLLARFGLAERAAGLARELSTGEAQRVALARAISHEPAVILADEPTGALDSAAAGVVLEAFDELRTAGRGFVIVTHDPAVAAHADRLVRMRDGRLFAD